MATFKIGDIVDVKVRNDDNVRCRIEDFEPDETYAFVLALQGNRFQGNFGTYQGRVVSVNVCRLVPQPV